LKELPLKDHEQLTGEIIQESDISKQLIDTLLLNPKLIAAIVDNTIDIGENKEIQLYRNLLSGVLDPDKLDYLNRDAYFCGVPYGIQDTDFIINKMEPHKNQGIILSQQGISSVENILFSKYLMYKTVYWHKTVRIATAMIKKALYLGIEESEIKSEELYNLDDETFNSKFLDHSYPPLGLINKVSMRILHKALIEIPFSNKNKLHKDLTSLNFRTKKEMEIINFLNSKSSKKLSPHDIIIDVPESISFETDLSIKIENDIIPFSKANSVFSPSVIDNFTATIRIIRLLIAPEFALSFKKYIPKLIGLLQ
jgi:HD superfamily phosphohydrolase